VREDRLLGLDEVPVSWSPDERQQAALLHLANTLDKSRRAVWIHRVQIGLALVTTELPLSEMMRLQASQPFIGCGLSAITDEILERANRSRRE
jgi:hypothetical protein